MRYVRYVASSWRRSANVTLKVASLNSCCSSSSSIAVSAKGYR
jgi:hypothetical protein